MTGASVPPPGRPDPLRAPTWGLGDVAAGIIASMVLSVLVGGLILGAGGWSGVDEVPIWGLALLQIPLWSGYLAVTWWAARTKGNGLVADLGMRSNLLDVPIGLVIGVATQLVVVPLLYLPILELTGRTADDLSAPARDLAARATGVWSWLLFAAMVGFVAPFVEELFYRGLFIKAMEKRGATTAATVIGTSLVFAAVHLQMLQFAGLFAFGVVAAWFAVRTGRLGGAIWAHIGFNMTSVVVLYLNVDSYSS